MELLAELAATSASGAAAAGSLPSSHFGNPKTITCECGPVLVSDEMAAKSVTIHGDVDPVQHPLWQRRFLTTDGLNAAVCFYVNEVLGVASSQPPNPPRQCVGGILADSMVSAQGLRVFNSVLIFIICPLTRTHFFASPSLLYVVLIMKKYRL